jgi:hypothetical protein
LLARWLLDGRGRSVHLGSICRSISALAIAAALCGCGTSLDSSGWFSKPVDLFGSRGGYTYSQLDEAKKERPITPNDLVDANGACTAFAPPPAAPDAGSGNADAASRLGGGVAIGMSECDVISRVGPPNAVNLSSNPRGDRMAVLTFNSGPRPGIYRFVGGRLAEMDRVEEPPPSAPPAKKKPAKNDKPKPNPAT